MGEEKGTETCVELRKVGRTGIEKRKGDVDISVFDTWRRVNATTGVKWDTQLHKPGRYSRLLTVQYKYVLVTVHIARCSPSQRLSSLPQLHYRP